MKAVPEGLADDRAGVPLIWSAAALSQLPQELILF
jgi:hypothetical protein